MSSTFKESYYIVHAKVITNTDRSLKGPAERRRVIYLPTKNSKHGFYRERTGYKPGRNRIQYVICINGYWFID